LSWCHCPCPNGVVVVDVQASLQFKGICRCCDSVIALVTMALLPSSSWCRHPCHNGVVAIVDAQVSLLLSQWHCRPRYTGTIINIAQVLLPLLHRRCLPYHADLVALTSHGHCHRHCTSVAAPVCLEPFSQPRDSTRREEHAAFR
jgi:hypothetical protein